MKIDWTPIFLLGGLAIGGYLLLKKGGEFFSGLIPKISLPDVGLPTMPDVGQLYRAGTGQIGYGYQYETGDIYTIDPEKDTGYKYPLTPDINIAALPETDPRKHDPVAAALQRSVARAEAAAAARVQKAAARQKDLMTQIVRGTSAEERISYMKALVRRGF